MIELSNNFPIIDTKPDFIYNYKEELTCFLIGETSLLIQCGESLLKRKHQILGVISPDRAISQWANENGIPYIEAKKDWKAFLGQYSFDYLFSIANSLRLPPEILRIPRQLAINYHDSPLPKYAGINATSWALMNREKTHAVTWHVMSARFDEGDILKQFPVDIAENDTAFTLDAKCYEAAVDSFIELINELSEQRVKPIKQNLEERTYFSRSKTPMAGYIFSWNRCALDIDAFVRALNFGLYRNSLGTPKFAIESDLIIVSKLEVLDSLSEFPSGTITAIEPSFIKISTASYDVALHQVLTVDGQNLSISELVTQFGLHEGYQFKDITPDLAKDVETFDSLISKHEAFWVDRLTTLQPITVPYAKSTASHLKPKCYVDVNVPLPPNVITFLEECHPEWNRGDFMLAAIVAYLARLGGIGCFDIGFRDIDLQRQLSRIENFFASYIPCRIDINFEQNFEEVFAAVRRQVELIKRRQTYTRDIAVRYPELQKALSWQRQQLFPVIIEQVQNLADCEKQPSNALILVIPEDGKECCWIYDSEIFDDRSIERMLRQFETFVQSIVTQLEGIAANPIQPISELPLLTQRERHQLVVEWNNTTKDYPQDKCIHQLFEEQVELTPDAVAIVFEGEQLTYRELNARANQLAHYLLSLGVEPEVLVGICVERSLEMVVGLLGILKAGGAYVPLDPAYPGERLAFMLEDSAVPVLLTQQRLVDRLPQQETQIVCLDTQWEAIAQYSSKNIACGVNAENLAYVIYTSGSTGKPKGVTIQHRSLVNYTTAVSIEYEIEKRDRVLQFASISFDASAEEIYPCLTSGATLVLRTDSMLDSVGIFLQKCQNLKLTVLSLPTAYWHELTARLSQENFVFPPSLRLVLIGGEKALPERLKTWLEYVGQRVRLLNTYGPTEATVVATIHDLSAANPELKELPIGRPISNVQTYILDQYQQPVPIGVPGELHIGGAGLARGYLNHPDLTEAKFIPNSLGNEPGSCLYKTGDKARYLPDGNIEFLGRIDNQVKIRGFRIELGEIETAISQHPSVKEAVVIATENNTGNKQLVTYIVPQTEVAPSISDLRHFLKQKLPDYMIPAAFVMLDDLPLTPNGKVDRRALPEPELRPELSLTFVAPRTPIEEILASIWACVLGIEQVGVHDNFFELGGHSLLATQVISRVRDTMSVELPLRSLFEAPTVATLAQQVENSLHSGSSMQAEPLLPIPRSESIPLSFAQARLWFLDQLQPNSSFYNIPLALRLIGQLNIAALQSSINAIIQRHEALRTNFATQEGQPVQVIASTLNCQLQVVNLLHLPESDREIEAQRLVNEQANRPFNLEREPLLRGTVLQLGETEYVLLLTMHHIISDGWSLGVFVRELTELYKAFCTGAPPSLPLLPVQYADFAVWQRQWLQGEILVPQLDYWKKQLLDAPVLLELPTDRPRPAVLTFRGGYYYTALSLELSAELTALSKRAGVTLFMTLLAAFGTLLYRYSGQDNIVVGTPVANRNRREIEGLIGFFVNTLVLRTDLSGNPSFEQLLNRVREVAIGAYAHQDLPFEQLVEALQPTRDLSYTPLFQVMFALDDALVPSVELPELTVSSYAVEIGTAKFDLTLSMENTADGLVGEWEYNADLFDEVTIARMARHFQTLLEAIAANPIQPISQLPLLTETECHQLLVEWNNTFAEFPQDKCIHQLFEEQVERSPDAVALVFEGTELTYLQLNARANQLAHYLLSLGVEPEVLVGICVERSLEMVVGLLGILKAGGAYVPLDPAYPSERLAFMLEDSAVSVLLTQQRLVDRLPKHEAQIVCLDTQWEAIAQYSSKNIACDVKAENLAYVIYTSGSTGKPKGVTIQHRSLVNYTTAVSIEYEIEKCDSESVAVATLGASALLRTPLEKPKASADRILQFSSISFDVSAEEIYTSLTSGATLVLRTDSMLDSVGVFLQKCRDWEITVLALPTAYWHELTAFLSKETFVLPPSLRLIIIGGEKALPERLKTWIEYVGQRVRLVNNYGPTEATVGATIYDCSAANPASTQVPIGRPIRNVQTYILDRYQQPVPIGVPGELHIGGAGLARGYLDYPDLTQEKFIPNSLGNEPGLSLYKTGDKARYLPDGNIEFLGRIDNQVKIRGFRIELGEIETAISQHPSVKETVVIATENNTNNKQLVAYIVPQTEVAPSISDLRCFLKQKLPDYMIPAAFVMLDNLPLTPNGKVDHRALPEPELRPELSLTFVAPRTPIEEMLANIWASVLGIEKVGVHNNFFELGGHSLLAAQVISRARDTMSVELPLRSLFEAPTVATLAEHVENSLHSGQSIQAQPLLPIPRSGDIPLSFAQARLWFLDQLQPNSAFYNIPIALHLSGQLNVAAIESSLNEIIRRHEVLRTNFTTIEGQPVQVIASTLELKLLFVDLQNLPFCEREVEAQRLVTTEAERPFDLEREPLVRAKLLQLDETEYVFVLTVHHIIFDGWSTGVFYGELAALYEAFCTGKPKVLPELPVQYADFAVWQRHWLTGEVKETQFNYWKQQLLGAPALLELPTDRPRRAIQTFRGAHQYAALPLELSQALAELSKRAGVTLFMTLYAAFVTLLYRYTGSSDIVVGTPVANRNRQEIEWLIGFFVNTLALRTDLSGNPSFEQLLGRVREVALGAYTHQDLPFEQLVEALQPERSLSYTPLFQVMFALDDASVPSMELPDLTVSEFSFETETTKFDLTLSMENTASGLIGVWEYNSDLFDAATIERMTRHFQALLEGIVANPIQSVSELPLLTERERHQLLFEWNNTTKEYPQDKCIHQLFEEQVERTPEAVAVVFEGEQLTYQELNARANQLAHYLQTLGVGAEVLVGICVERSLEMVIGLLGILKAGGAYVPIDPTYPQERLAFMVADAQVSILLTQERLVDTLPAHSAQVICLDTDWDIASHSQENTDSGVTSDNLIYVIYTSGSTGRPKGTMNIHKALCNRLLWMQDTYELTSQDRVLQKTPFSFDVSVWEFFWPLLTGARLVIAQPGGHQDSAYLVQLIAREQITTVHFVPSMLQVFLESPNLESCCCLKRVICSGEALAKALQERCFVHLDTELHNLYGPTEAAIDVTYWQCQRHSQLPIVPIGRPIANTQIYILDSQGKPTPVGVPGELHIGGDGLAKGYLNRPELTAEKFISNPFSHAPDSRLYKTGDLARYLPDGNIEYLGRIDNQVKIRGFRIELGEIEAVLSQHPGVRETAVIAREHSAGDKQLVAYVVPHQEPAPTNNELRRFVKEQLPDYMVPNAFVMLCALPLTPNGKVDRQSLPAPDLNSLIQKTDFVAPGTPTEELVASIWAKVLGVEQVGINDNFFELGGHSLLATQLLSQVSDTCGVELPLSKLFEAPTVASISNYIEAISWASQSLKPSNNTVNNREEVEF
jgi:amino acid adenylation domain-containing protein